MNDTYYEVLGALYPYWYFVQNITLYKETIEIIDNKVILCHPQDSGLNKTYYECMVLLNENESILPLSTKIAGKETVVPMIARISSDNATESEVKAQIAEYLINENAL